MSTPSSVVNFRKSFFAGLLVLAPLVVTVWAFTWIIGQVGGRVRPLFESFLPVPLRDLPFLWDILATVFVVLLVAMLGYISHYVFGKFFLEVGERFIQNIPGVSPVYKTVKQIVDTFSTQNRNLFNKVVLVEYPRKGMWTLGFLTNKEQHEAQARIGPDIWTVFVPTTPNPTSGFLLLLPKADVIELEMSVGEGMKMIISGGAVTPAGSATRSPFPPK